MPLTGSQLAQVHQAILAAYSRDELRRVVKVRMEVDFDAVAPERGFDDQVWTFVTWADRQRKLQALATCVAAAAPDNEELQALADQVVIWLTTVPPAEPLPSATVATIHDVFLGYSRHDADVMHNLRTELQQTGFSVWSDERLELGTTSWQRAIEEAIVHARCIVVILSPDAKESQWVNIEVSFAKRIGRRIFPILVRGGDVDAVPLVLLNTQHLDARGNDAAVSAKKLIRDIRKYLHDVDAAGATVGTDPATKHLEHASPAISAAALPPSSASGTTTKRPPKAAPPTHSLPDLPVAVANRLMQLGIELVRIPAGEFLMGSNKSKDPQASGDELPQHIVALDEYLITKYPITNSQFLDFVDATGYTGEHAKLGFDIEYDFENVVPSNTVIVSVTPDIRRLVKQGKGKHPITDLNTAHRAAYCDWLLEVTGLQWRIPTEEEWEKAARGTDGRIWPWGNDPPDAARCNYGNQIGDTTPVDQFPLGASPYGVMDCVGNVREETNRTSDSYWQKEVNRSLNRPPAENQPVLSTNNLFEYEDYTDVQFALVDYESADLRPYRAEYQGEYRGAYRTVNRAVNRGCSFSDDEYATRCAYRGRIESDRGIVVNGFRLVADASQVMAEELRGRKRAAIGLTQIGRPVPVPVVRPPDQRHVFLRYMVAAFVIAIVVLLAWFVLRQCSVLPATSLGGCATGTCPATSYTWIARIVTMRV